MEAVPRLPMLGLELKTSSDSPNFGPKLKQYIGEFYREDPDAYNNEIHQLEGLRSAAVRPAHDKTGCVALKRYFAQLKGLQSRFPMSKNQAAAVTFAWRDLFANIVCPLADIRFEMVCILYNIGALHCKLGATETRSTQESMKVACTHFQTAVWAFQHLKEHYPQPSGVDLSPDIMKLFQDISLAQAQECILEKSMQDSRKPGIVGAIAMQAVNHYKSALAALEPSSSSGQDNVCETVGFKTCNAWTKSIAFKVAYLECVIYLYQGMQSEEQQKYGERFAFYQAACDKLQEARKLSKGLPKMDAINEALAFTNDVVEGKRKAAKNENEFIYHEEVPEKEFLPEPKPAALAKGLPINFGDPEVSGPDIFGRLVPMRAHEASSMYSEEKAKLLRKIGSSVEAKDAQLNDFMSSLQLDELNILNDQERLPQELVDICASLSVKTDAIQKLVESMNILADIHTEVTSLFADIKICMEEEEKNEKEFQLIMGKRPPSNISTELTRETNKYLEAHNKANESNQTLHKAMTIHLSNLKILSLPLDELQKHVPSIESIRGTIDNAAIGEMRGLIEKVNEMRAQRSMLVLQLREAVNSDDITSQLLTRTGESLDDIFKQEIEKHNKTVALIEQNMLAQENILKALTDAYGRYAPSRKIISDVLKKREGFLTAMTTSYETYEDLMKKSLKGIEFYKKLHTTVSRQHSRLKSICKVQQEEREQLLASNMPQQVTVRNDLGADNKNMYPQKEEVSSAPKLKDFLPYMKNRGASQISSAAPEIGGVDSAQASQLYPPYIRPAPVGSEDSSTVPKPTYLSDQDPYKNYQASQMVGPYGTQYSDQNPYSYASANYANSASEQKSYQAYPSYNETQYNVNYGNTSNVDPVKPTDLNTAGYSNPDASQYNKNLATGYPSNVSAYGSTNANYPAHSTYENYEQNKTMEAKAHDSYNAYGNYQYGNQNQDEANKLSNQMQNLNVTYSMPGDNTDYTYANTYANPYDPTYSQKSAYSAQPEMPAVMATQSLNINPAHITSTIQNPLSGMYSRNNYNLEGTNQSNTTYPGVNYQNPYVPHQMYSTNATTSLPGGQPNQIPVADNTYNYMAHQNYSYGDVADQTNASPNHVTNQAQPSNIVSAPDATSYYGYQNPYYANNPTAQQYGVQSSQDATTPTNNSYTNHPGYSYNVNTGAYEYNYGYQNSAINNPPPDANNVVPQQQNVYTNAGTFETTQTPSTPIGNEQNSMGADRNSQYYSLPYGHQSSQNFEGVGQAQYSNNNEQPNAPSEKPLTYVNSNDTKTTTTFSNQGKTGIASSSQNEPDKIETKPPAEAKEPSAIDLLSGLDFSFEQAPLMPEIKVPPVSETVIVRKPTKPFDESIVDSKVEIKSETKERPPKRDLFSDPSLLNKFTQEVKSLQQFVDGFTKKTHSGITMLDSKWKKIQETQAKENHSKTTNDAKKYPQYNASQDVVPYDDTRVLLNDSQHSDSYVNASHVKEISSWCHPLIISDLPVEDNHSDFWHMILQQNVAIMICLLTEIELQGKFYGPTAKGQALEFPSGLSITLEDTNCNVNWTERKLSIKYNKKEHKITHYQINVFPARVVSAPLVMLIDKVLGTKDENDPGNLLPITWIHCSSGAGRSALIALLTMVMCQVRAGYVDLRDMLDSGVLYLCGTRTNVLEDTKYLVDIYRTVLFYVQGVLCSGTVMFNGEAVSVPTGASIPPPPITQPKRSENFGKFSKESFEEMKQAAGLKSGDMQDPLSYLDPLWSLKKRKD